MRLSLGLAMAATFLTGCGGSSNDSAVIVEPDGSVTEVAETQNASVTPPILPVPPSTSVTADGGTLEPLIVGDIAGASFDNAAGTLAVQIGFDGSESLQPYVAAGTVNGYSRFTIQDDPLDREFQAFARESDDGQLQAVVVTDGGQFNRFFGGGIVIQNSFEPVTTGLASYAGDYVGITNVGPDLVTGNGADVSTVPGSSTEITGTVFINADFADGLVNGSVYDRVFDPDGFNIDLPTIVLTVTEFGENGQFTGDVEFEDLTPVGNYDGAFGGDETQSIATVVSLGEGFLEGATINGVETEIFDEAIGETEYGVFVLGQCPAGGAACFDAN